MMQAARTDAVRATFILLNLLKSETESLTQFFLAHAEHCPPLTDTTADMDIDSLRSTTCADRRSALFL